MNLCSITDSNDFPLLAAAIGNKAGAGAWLKAKLLGRSSSQDIGVEGKENNAPKRDLDEESAAVVIQSRKYH
jgi:hypothetical protein